MIKPRIKDKAITYNNGTDHKSCNTHTMLTKKTRLNQLTLETKRVKHVCTIENTI